MSYLFVATHLQGFSSADDLRVLVGDADSTTVEQLMELADRISTANGTRREITADEATNLAIRHPETIRTTDGFWEAVGDDYEPQPASALFASAAHWTAEQLAA